MKIRRFFFFRPKLANDITRREKSKPEPGIRTRQYMSVGKPREIINFVMEVG
jgi:hypothetical protein